MSSAIFTFSQPRIVLCLASFLACAACLIAYIFSPTNLRIISAITLVIIAFFVVGVMNSRPPLNALLLRAAQKGYKNVASVLLFLRADVNAKNDHGETPLHCAALRC